MDGTALAAIIAATLAALIALIGVVVGRLLERRTESQRWWRTQRRDAYAKLLICQQRFRHLVSLSEAERGEGQDIKAVWLAVQEATALVDLVAPEGVSKSAKDFVVASRRYYLAVVAIPSTGDQALAAGLAAAQAADEASNLAIVARHTFVENARADLLHR
jgi:hypothetical protein